MCPGPSWTSSFQGTSALPSTSFSCRLLRLRWRAKPGSAGDLWDQIAARGTSRVPPAAAPFLPEPGVLAAAAASPAAASVAQGAMGLGSTVAPLQHGPEIVCSRHAAASFGCLER